MRGGGGVGDVAGSVMVGWELCGLWCGECCGCVQLLMGTGVLYGL